MKADCLKPDDATIINVSGFAALLLLSLALLTTFYQNALAQVTSQVDALFMLPSSPSSHLLTYQNLTAGFKIGYPPYWQKTENITNNASAVYFTEPLSGARFTVANFEIPQLNVLNEPKNLILSTIFNAFTQPFQPVYTNKSALTTLAGNPANRTDLTYFLINGNPARITILSSLIGDKVYILSYAASKSFYALFLPTATEMIDSFSVSPTLTSTPAVVSSTSTTNRNSSFLH